MAGTGGPAAAGGAAEAGGARGVPATAPNADAFVGSFKGDTLDAAFGKVPQSQSEFVGGFDVGEKHFSANARLENGKLVGTFTSDGNKFDFTATLDGTTMTLKTGSTTYFLKKPEPKKTPNPLDTAKPQNPLDTPGR